MRDLRTFSQEFKRQVVEELMSGESRPAQLCRRHNISPSLLYYWKKQYSLGKFNNEGKVRNALIQSLSSQKDPVVQIALIQLLVKIKETGVLKQLEELTKDASTMKAVKDEAYSGILKLS